MNKSKKILAENDIRSAIQRGKPLYEVKSNNTTLEFSPRLADIRTAVGGTISCNVFCVSPSGDKYLVASRQNRKMTLNTINLQVN